MGTVAIFPSTVGYHWEELFDPFRLFKEAGWNILFFTVEGKQPVADPNSVQERPFLSWMGLGVRKSFSPDTQLGQELLSQLNNHVLTIEQLDISTIDAIYIPGGHGCLFDVNVNHVVHEKILQAYQNQKIISAVCHGTSCLAFVKDNNEAIIKDKEIIGFLDGMDSFLMALGLVDQRFLPMPYRNEKAMKDAGANITWLHKLAASINPAYMVVDLPFVTGVGPKAAAKVAQKVIDLAKAKSE